MGMIPLGSLRTSKDEEQNIVVGDYGNNSIRIFNTYHAAGECRRQVKNVTKCVKMSTFWNFMTIFGITMKNAFR